MSVRAPLSNPGVFFPPPLYFIAGVGAGLLLDRYIVALPIPPVLAGFGSMLGIGLVGTGLLLMAWGVVTFRRAGTAIIPHQSASRLVLSGPYRFTRNPMYTGFTIAYIGVSALSGTVWPLLLLPIVLLIVSRVVIQREERYLEDAFGTEYTEWCARVRRWL